MNHIPKGRIIARIHRGPPLRTFSAPTPHRIILDEGPGYVEMMEASVAHDAVTLQLITDEDGREAQITTMVWPTRKHAAALAMLAGLDCTDTKEPTK